MQRAGAEELAKAHEPELGDSRHQQYAGSFTKAGRDSRSGGHRLTKYGEAWKNSKHFLIQRNRMENVAIS